MVYKASLDKTAIAITAGVTILFAVLVIRQFAVAKDQGWEPLFFITLFCVLIYGLSYAFRPVAYTVTGGELVIRRLIGNVHVKRSEIQSVEVVERGRIGGSIRTFGVGGLFGYYGNFANFELGRMTWYATRRDRPVLIRTVYGKKIVVTPDERERFVAELCA